MPFTQASDAEMGIQGSYPLVRCFTLIDNDTKSSDSMIIIVERALRHEKISRVPRKDPSEPLAETKAVSTMGGLGRRAGKDFESHRRRC